MYDYKPNSNKSKEEHAELTTTEKKKVEKVVTGQVKTRKKSEIRKMADVFISEDAQNVKSYILMDVLVPAIKKAVSDIVTNGIDMILYGGSGRTNRNTNVSRVSYTNYSDRNTSTRSSESYRTRYSYDDIVLESRVEAEEVLSRMDEIINMYGVVSVSDLNDLVGKPGSYTDNKYGWTNIRNAEAVRVRDGYLLKLPKALPID